MTTVELDVTHDPAARSFVADANAHPEFPLQNLPFGVFHRTDEDDTQNRGGVRIGDQVLDLAALAVRGVLSGRAADAANAAAGPTLNALLALGPDARRALRHELFHLLRDDSTHREHVESLLYPVGLVELALPAAIGDYTDFYAGIHHARSMGALFRPDDPLLPNYKWVPIGYHGRASSVGVSPGVVHRPRGQLASGEGSPEYAATRRLDIELELGVWIGADPTPDAVTPIGAAAEHIAGYCLLNDWSARDIQAWEYQPLGPFLSKSFATTVSSWIVTPEALVPFRIPLERPADDPVPLDYLHDGDDLAHGALAIDLEVEVSSAAMRDAGEPAFTISRTSTRHLYWTAAQLVAHHGSGGLQLQPGDLLGSGTISGPAAGEQGSLIEMTHGGRDPITLPTGEQRIFLADGDEIVLRARANRPGFASVGFGECRGVVATPLPLG